MVSCLCGVLTRRKTLAAKKVPKGGDDVASVPKGGNVDTLTQSSAVTAEDNGQTQLSRDNFAQLPPPVGGDQQKQLPPPPGSSVSAAPRHPMRSTSCLHVQPSRFSSTAGSKLKSSMSMRVPGSGSGGGRSKEKKYNNEDSIWKKRIILGEKCRVPDEDEDPIFYDEDGNRVSVFHPRTHSAALSISRTSSCIHTNTNTNNDDYNQEELSSK